MAIERGSLQLAPLESNGKDDTSREAFDLSSSDTEEVRKTQNLEAGNGRVATSDSPLTLLEGSMSSYLADSIQNVSHYMKKYAEHSVSLAEAEIETIRKQYDAKLADFQAEKMQLETQRANAWKQIVTLENKTTELQERLEIAYNDVIRRTIALDDEHAKAVILQEQMTQHAAELGGITAEGDALRIEANGKINALEKAIAAEKAINDEMRVEIESLNQDIRQAEKEKEDARSEGETLGRDRTIRHISTISEAEQRERQRMVLLHVDREKKLGYEEGFRDAERKFSPICRAILDIKLPNNPSYDNPSSNHTPQGSLPESSPAAAEMQTHSMSTTHMSESKDISNLETPMTSILASKPTSNDLFPGLRRRSSVYSCATLDAEVNADANVALRNPTFNVDKVKRKLADLPPAGGIGGLPPTLAEFDCAFLQEYVGGTNDFWKSMELTLDIDNNPPTKQKIMQWPHILRVHKVRGTSPPDSVMDVRPKLGAHGALLLVTRLDDDCGRNQIYPTFIDISKPHEEGNYCIYAGQYKVVDRERNPRAMYLKEFIDYLANDKRGIKFIQANEGAEPHLRNNKTISRTRVESSLDEGGTFTSWVVLQFVGFDEDGYGTLLDQYRKWESFSTLNKGVPEISVEEAAGLPIVHAKKGKSVEGDGRPNKKRKLSTGSSIVVQKIRSRQSASLRV